MKSLHAAVALVAGSLMMAFACTAERALSTQTELESKSPKQMRAPKLPSPTGPFGVGRVGYAWTDESRPDRYAADSKAHRRLMVYLWYPTRKVQGSAWAEYLPGAKLMDADVVVAPAMREEFEGAWPLIVSKAVRSLAIENAPPVAQSPKKFPVLILAHGAGGTTFEYTSLVGELVSHGYVVAAVENTYAAPAVAFPDGQIVAAYHEPAPPNLSPDERFQRMMKGAGIEMDTGARDMMFALNQLTRLDNGDEAAFVLRKRLDLNRVASMGHSAGGANATLACQMDARFRACLSLDGQMPPIAAFPENSEGKWFTQPVLLEVDHKGRWMGFNPAQNDAFLKKKEDQLNRCPAGSYDVVLKSPGLVHGSFSDYPLFAAIGKSTETKDALQNLTLIESYIEAFLDQTLNQMHSPLLENAADRPEATVKPYGH